MPCWVVSRGASPDATWWVSPPWPRSTRWSPYSTAAVGAGLFLVRHEHSSCPSEPPPYPSPWPRHTIGRPNSPMPGPSWITVTARRSSSRRPVPAWQAVERLPGQGRVQFMSRDGLAALSGPGPAAPEAAAAAPRGGTSLVNPGASPATRETSWAAGVRMTSALRCRTAPMIWRAARRASAEIVRVPLRQAGRRSWFQNSSWGT